MKRIDQKKNKVNVSTLKKSNFIVLRNAGERTQGLGGPHLEGFSWVKKIHQF